MSQIPQHLKFTETHEWVNSEEDNLVVGITDHAQHLLGDLVFVELPQMGVYVSAGDEIAVVESVKAASDVYAPISGKIVAINEALQENPELVNQDPYGAAWLFKIEPNNRLELNALLDHDQYRTDVAKED